VAWRKLSSVAPRNPILKVVSGDGGDGRKITGGEVVDEVVKLLSDRIPLLDPDDPSLPHLRDLHDLLTAGRRR
jgi:hypothetical protein